MINLNFWFFARIMSIECRFPNNVVDLYFKYVPAYVQNSTFWEIRFSHTSLSVLGNSVPLKIVIFDTFINICNHQMFDISSDAFDLLSFLFIFCYIIFLTILFPVYLCCLPSPSLAHYPLLVSPDYELEYCVLLFLDIIPVNPSFFAVFPNALYIYSKTSMMCQVYNVSLSTECFFVVGVLSV